jgi:hypothetical protein
LLRASFFEAAAPDVMLHSRVSNVRLAGAVRTLAAAYRAAVQ